MSEADAEGGLHGLDEPLAITNDTRLNIEFAFSDRFFLRRSPTEPRFRPFNFKKIPPRKNKNGKAERGEGGAPSPRGEKRIHGASQDLEHRRCERCTVPVGKWSDCWSHHAIGAYALV